MADSGQDAGAGADRRRAGRGAGRRAPYDPGRWRTQRQRFGLDETARPPAPDRCARISALLPSLMTEIQGTAYLHIEELQRLWPDLAGAPVAGHARPGTLKNGVLTVFVDHSLWLAELRPHVPQLLAKIRAAYPQGEVQRLVLRLDPDFERPGRRGRR